MRTDRGFTLLEVLVAFIIAALALGVVLRGTVGGMRSVTVADHYQEALSRARSRLAAIGHGMAVAPRHESGDDGGGFRWTIDITPAAFGTPSRQPTDAAHGPAPRLSLYQVAVTETW